jgi:hypothetical protein
VNTVAELAVLRLDRAVDIFTIHKVFVASQAELAPGLWQIIRQAALVRVMAAGTALFNS